MVVVSTNISALRSGEAMRQAESQMGDAMERLSTGFASTQQQMTLRVQQLHQKWKPRQEVLVLLFVMQMMQFH